MEFFATCPKHLEELLAAELAALGATTTCCTTAGVRFEASLETARRAVLWSRLANRILQPLAQFAAPDGDALYAGARQVDWTCLLDPDDTLAVDCTGRTEGITNTHYGSLRVKDAVCDRLRERTGRRPSVDVKGASLRINLHLAPDGRATLALDLGRGSLHRRRYRLAGGAAPLKENLAAAVLLRAGWPALAEEGAPLADPMCGSGTLLIEAACIAADIAPGLLRGGCPWPELLAEAEERRRAGRARPEIRGGEADPRAVAAARRNVAAAGLAGWIEVEQAELATFAPRAGRAGLVVCNPPYGERLGQTDELRHLYRALGRRLKESCRGWQAAVLTGDPELGKTMGLRARKRYKLFNGALPCQLLLFEVDEPWFVEPRAAPRPDAVALDDPGAAMFANRLKKNLKRLGKWARKHDVSCYRLYDADMPEYALAVDRYGEQWVHVCEYAPPSTVDPQRAEERLRQALSAIPAALGVDPQHVVLKTRRRQRGAEQYTRQDRRGTELEVREGSARLLVNLTDYLDTGLFLDHRPLRLLIGDQARGKRFLNLFCYTAAATVHAATGGAAATTSVDSSPTYLAWARRNLALNGCSEARHRLVQADCRQFLARERGRYELILLDPPTFSNTRRPDRETFDLQRDHAGLIQAAAARLAPGGTLYFSCNFRRFELDQAALAGLQIEPITPRTIDRDFERDPRIHQCWRISAP